MKPKAYFLVEGTSMLIIGKEQNFVREKPDKL